MSNITVDWQDKWLGGIAELSLVRLSNSIAEQASQTAGMANGTIEDAYGVWSAHVIVTYTPKGSKP